MKMLGKVVGHAYFTDGTTDDITVKELLDSSNKGDIMGKADGDGKYTDNAGWYTFSKNSAGEYSLYLVEGKYLDSKTQNPLETTYNYSGDDKDVTENGKVSFLFNEKR